jgi:hypothetical protein
MFHALVAFVIGFTISESMQWFFWVLSNPKKPAFDFWKWGWAHAGINLGIDVIAGYLWVYGMLAQAIDWLGHTVGLAELHILHENVPVNPPWGIIVGFSVDFVGDKIAFILRLIAKRKFAKLNGGSDASSSSSSEPDISSGPGD